MKRPGGLRQLVHRAAFWRLRELAIGAWMLGIAFVLGAWAGLVSR